MRPVDEFYQDQPPTKAVQCVDLAGDRALGELWERKFCAMASRYGRSFTAHQIGRPKSAQSYVKVGGKYHPMTLPDITIWTRPGEHHEVKHKDPTASGKYGLERYRLDALLWFAEETGQSVYYTIHDYSMQNAPTRELKKRSELCNHEHWLSCSVIELADAQRDQPDEKDGTSYVRGVPKTVPICYWSKSLFQPVIWLWRGEPQRDMFGSLVSVQQPPAPAR